MALLLSSTGEYKEIASDLMHELQNELEHTWEDDPETRKVSAMEVRASKGKDQEA